MRSGEDDFEDEGRGHIALGVKERIERGRASRVDVGEALRSG